jgi:phosphatidylinositol alpha-1,6-mannosyltransferase
VKNGYGNITHELLSSLKEMGHQITLLLPENDEFSQYDIEGITVERVLPKYLFNYKSVNIYKYLLWKYKAKTKFDLVHSLFAFPYAPLMCREAKRLGLPFVVGAQGTYGVQPLSQSPEKYAMKYAYRNARAIIVPSEYTKKAILNEAEESFDITVIHNGVNYERFVSHQVDNEDLRSKFAGKKVILTVGELKSRKGQDLVIKALPEIVKRHPDVLYVLVGYPSWQKHLEELAKEVGVEKHIHITGPVDDNEILDYFKVADLYVHTPRVHNKYQFEGFGIVYLEAGACGKTSVGTDAGGIKDALLHEKTGLVADAGNVGQIADYINKLLADNELRLTYEKNAQEYAREHSWKNIAREYERVYKSIM